MTAPTSFVQVLLFRDIDKSQELGPALWAACQEVELFFNQDTRRANFTRHYLAPDVPKAVRAVLPADWQSRAVSTRQSETWESMRGRFTSTCDQEKLLSWVNSLTQPHPSGARTLLVTDQEITPPPSWRYIIWDRVKGDVVVSAASVDPTHWKYRDEHRVATVKHRVRTACLSAIGAQLGLKKCDNPECFRRKPVLSVLDLDLMLYLGPEHGLPAVAEKGFEPRPRNPAEVQPIKDFRRGQRERTP